MVTRDPWVSKHFWGEEQKDAPAAMTPHSGGDGGGRQEWQGWTRGLLPPSKTGRDGGGDTTTPHTHTDQHTATAE